MNKNSFVSCGGRGRGVRRRGGRDRFRQPMSGGVRQAAVRLWWWPPRAASSSRIILLTYGLFHIILNETEPDYGRTDSRPQEIMLGPVPTVKPTGTTQVGPTFTHQRPLKCALEFPITTTPTQLQTFNQNLVSGTRCAPNYLWKEPILHFYLKVCIY